MNVPRFIPPTRIFGGYIFDCDGTLADTMPLHYAAWQHALRSAGATFAFTWELFESRAGMSLEATVAGLNEQFGVTLDPLLLAEAQRRKYETLEHQVAPVPGVLDFARAVARRARVSVASGSNRPSVLRTLKAIGALELFEVICTPEDVTLGKPHPEMFLLAAERMGVPPDDCVVFEDGRLGITAAQRARMECVVIAPGPRELQPA